MFSQQMFQGVVIKQFYVFVTISNPPFIALFAKLICSKLFQIGLTIARMA